MGFPSWHPSYIAVVSSKEYDVDYPRFCGSVSRVGSRRKRGDGDLALHVTLTLKEPAILRNKRDAPANPTYPEKRPLFSSWALA